MNAKAVEGRRTLFLAVLKSATAGIRRLHTPEEYERALVAVHSGLRDMGLRVRLEDLRDDLPWPPSR